ncbi:MAG: ABC transporter ATP-binding protein [Actinomycetota bacterium]
MGRPAPTGVVTAMPVIEAEHLRKTYRSVRRGHTLAVDDLSFSVPRGGVFGFLGPNGSGKTTTIRCLLGMVAPTEGRTRLLGAGPGDLHTVAPRVGSIVEAPAAFPTFSGRRNLRLLARAFAIPDTRVDAMLDRVGLAARADDPVKTYSLGMRQRLGIAAALLKDPEVLILDEPANGLDPAGIKEVRDLIRSLGNEGRTVFLSSHQLGEVQQVCDQVAILSHGRCIATGTVHEVLARGESAVVVRVEDPASGMRVLRDAGFDARTEPDGGIRVEIAPERAADITRALAARDMFVSELRPIEASLESVFLDLTKDADPATLTCPACGSETIAGKFCTVCGVPAGGGA